MLARRCLLAARVLAGTANGLMCNRPFAMSFDLTRRCNLHCRYCYWWRSKPDLELLLEEIVHIATGVVKLGVVHATLVGGEPTLRPEVIEALSFVVPTIWVVTNGGAPVPLDVSRPNVWGVISLDGVGKAHDTSRGKDGLYDFLRTRFFKTWRSSKIITSTTLHAGNMDQPEALLREWQFSGIRGMAFDFATPMSSTSPEEDCYLWGDRRNHVIDELLRLRRQYGAFLRMSPVSLEMLRPENVRFWADNCLLPKVTTAFDCAGRVKTPCVMGSFGTDSKPDCSRCGCHVPTILAGMSNLHPSVIGDVLWSF